MKDIREILIEATAAYGTSNPEISIDCDRTFIELWENNEVIIAGYLPTRDLWLNATQESFAYTRTEDILWQ